MLRAIAIYQINDDTNPPTFTKTTHRAPKITYYSLFVGDEFNNIENSFLSTLTHDDISQCATLYSLCNNEHHYVKRIVDKPYIMVICSKHKLDPKELAYLFINIKFVFENQEITHHTLDMIHANPLNYIAKDQRLIEANANIGELKVALNVAIEKIILRGEAIEPLIKSTAELSTASLKFKREAAKQNGYCGSCQFGS